MTALLPAISFSPFRSNLDARRYGLCSSPAPGPASFDPARIHRTCGECVRDLTSVSPRDADNQPQSLFRWHDDRAAVTDSSILIDAKPVPHLPSPNTPRRHETKILKPSYTPSPNQGAPTTQSLGQQHSRRLIQCPRRARASLLARHNPLSQIQSGLDTTVIERSPRVNVAQESEHNDSTPLEPFPVIPLVEPITPQRTDGHHATEDRASDDSVFMPGAASKALVGSSRIRQRLSDASSAFVHTVRTASMSNVSFSIMPRSSRFARSMDSQYLISHVRCSTDSDRSLTTASIDDAAAWRGVRRKQVLAELIATEESYVADLKALVYLYSTLMASTSSISYACRSSIQRNVTGLLRLHEGFLDQLHQARFRAAARKWADTASPTKIGPTRHARWRSADAAICDPLAKRQVGSRSSLDSPRAANIPERLGTADPVDVLELAEIFQLSLPSFSIYEDYCANHDIVAHELQKQTPALWSTYEMGMESLAHNLTAIDRKDQQERKGLTVGDLLIKPIQRICKYPLLLQDLVRQTPVVDGPGAHGALEAVLDRLKEVVQAVDSATDNDFARTQIRRKWLMQDRLNLQATGISIDAFRELGQVNLCGILFVTYQTPSTIDGCYALCALFDQHLVIATPGRLPGKYDIFAVIHLHDLKIESACDGKGLTSHSAFYTFKLYFVAQSKIHEILLSACSPVEEDQWLSGLEGIFSPGKSYSTLFPTLSTQVYLDLKSVGRTFVPNSALDGESSIQRAATVGNRAPLCHVILRNTYNPQDLQEFRSSSPVFVNRSQSHASSNKIVVLAPKRSERTKLEAGLSEVWTKDRLPFPGMIANRGTQILRASAGSLARKLSLASIHAPFSRRSANTIVSSKKSYDALTETRKPTPRFEVRRESFEDSTPIRTNRPKEVPELDTMDSVIGRMIGGGTTRYKRLSLSSGEKGQRKNGKHSRRSSTCQIGPEDPANIFYGDEDKVDELVKAVGIAADQAIVRRVEEGLSTTRKKRWSNPMAMLKELGSEGIRNMLHSTR